MLIQFRVENFLSIKDSVVLSLLASKDNEHSEHLIVNGSKRYLKSAVIYGANASGKSNVLHAFWFMVNYVLTSHNQQLHKSIERSPFKFDRETPSRPSSFEVIFTANGIRYAYGFSVTDKAVIEEYLYYYPNGRQAIIFERQNTNDFRFTVDVDEQSMLKNRTSPNKLYLSVASNWSYSKVIPVLEWFASCQIITKHSAADAYELEAEQLKDDGYIDAAVKQTKRLKQISDAAFQRQDIDEIESLALALRKEIEAALQPFYMGHMCLYVTPECFDDPPKTPEVYNDATACVWRDGTWQLLEDTSNGFLLFVQSKSKEEAAA